MDTPHSSSVFSQRLKRFVLLSLGLLLAIGLGFMLKAYAHELKGFAQPILNKCLSLLKQLPPWGLLLALALLPLMAFPISPLYVATGLRCEALEAATVLGLGLALNLFLAYLLARGPLRRLLLRLVPEKYLPKTSTGSPIAVILLMRLAPLPLVVQNYTLGLLNVPLLPYLAISWPIQFTYGMTCAFASHALVGGHMTQLVIGLCGLVALSLGIQYLRKRNQKTSNPANKGSEK